MKHLVIVILILLPCLVAAQAKRAHRKPYDSSLNELYFDAWQRDPLKMQVGAEQLTKKQRLLAIKHEECYNTNRYNAQERRAIFPFNEAVNIRLVSFNLHPPEYMGDPKMFEESPHDLPIFIPIAPNKFKFNRHFFEEEITLTKTGIDSLTDILYNIGLTPVKTRYEILNPGSSCYNPRNAIVFLDVKGVITHYMEICFECEKYYMSSAKMRAPEYCRSKYELLRAFFKAQGLQYGTKLRDRNEE